MRQALNSLASRRRVRFLSKWLKDMRNSFIWSSLMPLESLVKICTHVTTFSMTECDVWVYEQVRRQLRSCMCLLYDCVWCLLWAGEKAVVFIYVSVVWFCVVSEYMSTWEGSCVHLCVCCLTVCGVWVYQQVRRQLCSSMCLMYDCVWRLGLWAGEKAVVFIYVSDVWLCVASRSMSRWEGSCVHLCVCGLTVCGVWVYEQVRRQFCSSMCLLYDCVWYCLHLCVCDMTVCGVFFEQVRRQLCSPMCLWYDCVWCLSISAGEKADVFIYVSVVWLCVVSEYISRWEGRCVHLCVCGMTVCGVWVYQQVRRQMCSSMCLWYDCVWCLSISAGEKADVFIYVSVVWLCVVSRSMSRWEGSCVHLCVCGLTVCGVWVYQQVRRQLCSSMCLWYDCVWCLLWAGETEAMFIYVSVVCAWCLSIWTGEKAAVFICVSVVSVVYYYPFHTLFQFCC